MKNALITPELSAKLLAFNSSNNSWKDLSSLTMIVLFILSKLAPSLTVEIIKKV